MVKVLTLFTVQTFGVVVAHAVTVDLNTGETRQYGYILNNSRILSRAPRTHHALAGHTRPLNGGTLRGMSVAETVSSHHHVVDGVVILLLDLHSGVQEVVSEGVELCELYSEVGDLQQVCEETDSSLINK